MRTADILLNDKVAIVTGAGRGIGRSIAVGFSRAGAEVVVTSRTVSELEETCKIIGKNGGKAIPIVCDVSKVPEVKELVKETLNRFGQIDILVNNAGISPFVVPIEDIREEGWDKIMNTNLKGVFICTQEVGRNMIKRRCGNVINMTSIGGVVGFPGQAAYCISKAGIIMLTKMFAIEWGKYNVNVNAIGAGMVKTRLTEKMRQNEALIKDRLKKTPLNRFASPDEIVGGALFLASNLSDYMTGQVIFIDGGRLAGG